MKSITSERRRATRSNPPIAAVVTFFLFLQTLFELLEDFFQIERFDHGAFFLGQFAHFLGVFQPFLQFVGDLFRFDGDAAKVFGKGKIEVVELRFGMHAERSSDVVKPIERRLVNPGGQSLAQGEGFLCSYGHFSSPQLVQKVDEHRR